MAGKKPTAPPPAITVVVDERWIGEWVAYGFIELGAYLEKHAAFAAYLDQHQEAP